MKRRTSVMIPGVLACILFGPSALAGGLPQDGGSGGGGPGVRPLAGEGPTPVKVAVYLIDLVRIDDVQRLFTADIALLISWRDPRLADPDAGLRRLPLQSVWHPRLIVVNKRSLSKEFPDVVEVDSEGRVFYRQRYFGSFSLRSDLRDFPFDTHDLTLAVVPGGFDTTEVALAIDETRTGCEEVLSITGFAVGTVVTATGEMHVKVQDRNFSRVTFHLSARRLRGYYFWKVFFTLAMIVVMSWMVFFIDPVEFGPQIGVSTASVFTLIAYQFILGNLLPRVSYLTRIDKYSLGCTAIVFLVLIEAVTTGYLVRRDRTEAARKMDRFARVLFPLAFVGIIVNAVWL